MSANKLACLAMISLLGLAAYSITPVHGEPAKLIMTPISPLKQYKTGTSLNDIQCAQGLQLIIKSSNNSPACVRPSTADRLVALGWGRPADNNTSSSDDQSTPKTITLDDNNRSITIKAGQNFLLKLGETYNWDISIDDQSVVGRIPNVMVIKDAQGLYQGHNAGQTTLTATGDPWCYMQKPACMMPSILFRLDITVTQ